MLLPWQLTSGILRSEPISFAPCWALARRKGTGQAQPRVGARRTLQPTKAGNSLRGHQRALKGKNTGEVDTNRGLIGACRGALAGLAQPAGRLGSRAAAAGLGGGWLCPEQLLVHPGVMGFGTRPFTSKRQRTELLHHTGAH